MSLLTRLASLSPNLHGLCVPLLYKRDCRKVVLWVAVGLAEGEEGKG